MEKVNINQSHQFLLKPSNEKKDHFYIRTSYTKDHSWRIGYKSKSILNFYPLIGEPLEGELADKLEREFQLEYLSYLEKEFYPLNSSLQIPYGYHRVITESGCEVFAFYDGKWTIAHKNEKIYYVGKETILNN